MATLIEELDSTQLILGFFNEYRYINSTEIFPFYIKGERGINYIFKKMVSIPTSYSAAPNIIRRTNESRGSFIYKDVFYYWNNNIIYNKKDKQLVMVLDKVNRKVYIQFGYLFTTSFLLKLGRNDIVYVENLSKILQPILPIKELSKIKTLEKELLNYVQNAIW